MLLSSRNRAGKGKRLREVLGDGTGGGVRQKRAQDKYREPDDHGQIDELAHKVALEATSGVASDLPDSVEGTSDIPDEPRSAEDEDYHGKDGGQKGSPRMVGTGDQALHGSRRITPQRML